MKKIEKNRESGKVCASTRYYSVYTQANKIVKKN